MTTEEKTRAERLGLEPLSEDCSLSGHNGKIIPLDCEIAHSIAISLKRIADALEGSDYKYGLDDIGKALQP